MVKPWNETFLAKFNILRRVRNVNFVVCKDHVYEV